MAATLEGLEGAGSPVSGGRASGLLERPSHYRELVINSHKLQGLRCVQQPWLSPAASSQAPSPPGQRTSALCVRGFPRSRYLLGRAPTQLSMLGLAPCTGHSVRRVHPRGRGAQRLPHGRVVSRRRGHHTSRTRSDGGRLGCPHVVAIRSGALWTSVSQTPRSGDSVQVRPRSRAAPLTSPPVLDSTESRHPGAPAVGLALGPRASPRGLGGSTLRGLPASCTSSSEKLLF